MAKKSAKELIKLLEGMGIVIRKEDKENYNYLITMYKEQLQKQKIDAINESSNAVAVDAPQETQEERHLREESQIKLIHREKSWPQDVIRCAREVGLNFEQIQSFPDALSLRGKIVEIKPSMHKRFIPSAFPAMAPPQKLKWEKSEVSFNVGILGGFGPPSHRAAREQQEIESQMRRFGCQKPIKIYIERNMIADDAGKLNSTVSVEYEKQVEIKVPAASCEARAGKEKKDA